MNLSRLLGAAILTTILFFATVAPANANFLDRWWYINDQGVGTGNPVLQADSTVEDFAAIVLGANAWNQPSVGPTFSYEPSAWEGEWNLQVAPPFGIVGFGNQPIDGPDGVLAETFTWVVEGHPAVAFSSVVIFDSAENWHDPVLGSIDPDQYDRWSVSTHEMGHVVGFDHHDEGSAWCPTGNPAAVQTVMCPSFARGLTNLRQIFGVDWELLHHYYSMAP